MFRSVLCLVAILTTVSCALPETAKVASVQSSDAFADNTARWLNGSADPILSQGVEGDLFLNVVTGHVFVKRSGNWTDIATIKGNTGTNGTNGASWFVTTSDPTSLSGSEGDFHLNSATGDIFKKTNSTWAKISSLAQQKWLSGTTAPSATAGAENDFYLDTVANKIYRKSSGTWSAVASFVSFSQAEIEKMALDAWVTPASKVSDTVYLLGLRNNANSQLVLVGTGVAYDSTTIVTNAHVFQGVFSRYIYYKQLGYNVDPVAVQNGKTSASAYILDVSGYHKNYDNTTVFTYDIGYFKTKTTLPSAITVQTDFTGLKVGQGLGTMGFPGETSSRIDLRPNATFKSGVVSALSAMDSSLIPTVTNAFIVQHNFNTTGGTSGSPVFDSSARLIALNNSGAVKWIWDDSIGDFTAIPVGSIGYSIRADLIKDMFDSQNVYSGSLASVYIPPRLKLTAGTGIQNFSGSQSVSFGSALTTVKTTANSLFGKTSPDNTYPDGSFEFWDFRSYYVYFSFANGSLVYIQVNGYDDPYYLPAIRDSNGICVGSSRSFILETYGYGYTTTYSDDGTKKYYNYSSLGISFGFKLGSDWYCDGIYLWAPNYYSGMRSLGAEAIPRFVDHETKKAVLDLPFNVEQRLK